MNLRDINISSKLSLMILSTVIGILAVTAFSLHSFKEQLYTDRKAKVQHQVEVVHQILNSYLNLALRGTLSQSSAQKLAISEIEKLRYGQFGYFWFTDLNNRYVMHPFKKDLIGTDLALFEDRHGKRLFAEMTQVAQTQGGGFVSYWWEKPGEENPRPKISYVKIFIPWNWTVGSGVYADDIETIYYRQVTIVGSALLATILIILAFYRVIARSISKPLAENTNNMRLLAKGHLDIDIPKDSANNEIGDLQRATACFQEKLLARQKDEEALNKLSAAVEQNPTSIIITNKEGVIEYVNPKFEEISGYHSEEVIGKNPRILNSGSTSHNQYKQLWKTISAGITWRGEFRNKRKDGTLYWEQASIFPIFSKIGDITHFIAIKEDINERKAVENKLFQRANYDILTGLPNRELAKDRLSQATKRARRNDSAIALIFIDLDNFKIINDTMGHEAGDSLLVEMADRLRQCIREEDTVARLGGDEFLVILPDIKNSLSAETISLKIIESASRPLMVNGNELIITTSVGISIFPDNADNSEDLLKNADAAMYKAKEAGGNTFRFFIQDMSIEALRRLNTESQLRQALKQHEFSLVYQPIVDIVTGKIIKTEALLRWENPSLGQISPDDFIPIAEDSGLIIPIGDWVLKEACRQVSEWNQQFNSNISIAVNTAYPQFRTGNFIESVSRTLHETKLPPELLEIEITERVIMHESKHIDDTMAQIRNLGVKLAIDDYGTGYSSITYLKRFPFTALKIDKSFVQAALERPEDATLVTAIVQLAHNLGLAITAEGVETEEQLDYLAAEGCQQAQGYLISRPLCPEAFEEYLKMHSSTKPLDTTYGQAV